MTEFTSYAHGTPSWVDVSSDDLEASTAFYTGLFGWEAVVVPDAGGYTMFRLRGKDVGALGPAQGGAPPAWTTYIASDDAAATAEAIAASGGAVLVEPMDVFDAGVMVLASDPGGATFGVWQGKAHPGAALANEPGAFCWNELVTPDPTAMQAFYTAVFGWQPEPMGDDYWGQDVGNGPMAGIGTMPDGLRGSVPPHWATYLAVADLEETLTRAQELGGALEHGPTETPFGPIASLVDPQGARFSVIQLAPPETAAAV